MASSILRKLGSASNNTEPRGTPKILNTYTTWRVEDIRTLTAFENISDYISPFCGPTDGGVHL
jgi:hypothetical protein